MKIVWERDRVTVRDVYEALLEHRKVAYTTVMTMLDRLARRGIVTRRKAGRAFVYAPAVSRDAVRRLALKEFLDSYFESSQRQLLQFLQGESRIAPAAPAVLVAHGLDPALL